MYTNFLSWLGLPVRPLAYAGAFGPKCLAVLLFFGGSPTNSGPHHLVCGVLRLMLWLRGVKVGT